MQTFIALVHAIFGFSSLTKVCSFGRRYQQATETNEGPRLVFSKQRIPAEILSGSQECIVCTESLSITQFPALSITATCDHPPTTCLDCITASIKADISNKLWKQIGCPECGQLLEYADVQQYADNETKER
jgi:hypothetical protein